MKTIVNQHQVIFYYLYEIQINFSVCQKNYGISVKVKTKIVTLSTFYKNPILAKRNTNKRKKN